MTFHHFVLIFILFFFVMSIYVSDFRVVMSVTIPALNIQFIFTFSC